jgi:hypothetical protein
VDQTLSWIEQLSLRQAESEIKSDRIDGMIESIKARPVPQLKPGGPTSVVTWIQDLIDEMRRITPLLQSYKDSNDVALKTGQLADEVSAIARKYTTDEKTVQQPRLMQLSADLAIQATKGVETAWQALLVFKAMGMMEPEIMQSAFAALKHVEDAHTLMQTVARNQVRCWEKALHKQSESAAETVDRTTAAAAAAPAPETPLDNAARDVKFDGFTA